MHVAELVIVEHLADSQPKMPPPPHLLEFPGKILPLEFPRFWTNKPLIQFYTILGVCVFVSSQYTMLCIASQQDLNLCLFGYYQYCIIPMTQLCDSAVCSSVHLRQNVVFAVWFQGRFSQTVWLYLICDRIPMVRITTLLCLYLLVEVFIKVMSMCVVNSAYKLIKVHCFLRDWPQKHPWASDLDEYFHK